MSLTTQQALLYRSLATLYNAGIPLNRALHILTPQMDHPVVRKALADVATRVEQGRRMSDAMAHHGLAFPRLHSQLVALGESTGSLHIVLEKLALQAEKATELRARLQAALTYPAVVFLVAMAVLILAPAVIFKDLLRLLQDLQVELPLATRLLVSASRLASSPFVLIPLIGLPLAFLALRRSVWEHSGWRRQIERTLLAVPALGPAIRAAVACDFCRSLATCHATGIPILKGLELSGSAADHLVFGDALRLAIGQMRDGETLHRALQAMDFFPAMALQMIAVGEESGRLSDMLERVARLAEGEVEHTLEVATAALGPMVLLFIGMVVGFVVVATMTPMLKVINSL